MAMLADAVLLPLALASLVTGLICSLGTAWGLFRHYWVLLKLLLNLVATVVLVLYTRSIEYAATVAAQPSWSQADRAVLQDPTIWCMPPPPDRGTRRAGAGGVQAARGDRIRAPESAAEPGGAQSVEIKSRPDRLRLFCAGFE